jgi:hypothetical protein
MDPNNKKTKRTKRTLPKTLPPDFYGNISDWKIISITPFKIGPVNPIEELNKEMKNLKIKK